MRLRCFLGLTLGWAICADAQILKQDFETGELPLGWMAMGQSTSSVRIARDPAQVRNGTGALAYRYSLDAAAGMSTAVLPAPSQGAFRDLKRIRFWAKSDHDTNLVLVLAEQKPGGGDYASSFWLPANQWQQVDLGLNDFVVNDGAKDAVDADGRLDPDQIQGIALLDLALMFQQMPAENPIAIERLKGEHVILIDDFELLSSSPAPPQPQKRPPGDSILIDGFDRGFLSWLGIGAVRLQLASTEKGPALMAAFRPVDGKVSVCMHRIANVDLTGGKRVAFDLSSENEVTLSVTFETVKGARYHHMIYPPAGRKLFRVNLSFADFERDEDSPADPAGALVAANIKSISIVDVTGMVDGTGKANTIWIGPIEISRKLDR